jgi:predicted RNA-binding protein with TRAM domain
VSEEDMRDMEVEETGEEGSGDLKMSMGEKN